MQCHKCKYEPTMAEMQLCKDSCIKCGVSCSDDQQSTRLQKDIKRPLLFFGILVMLVAAVFGWQWNERRQEREVLFFQLDQQIRIVNGLVGELLDQGAGLTRAQFFEKSARRVIDIDAVIAKALSIDDSVLPGLSQQAAAYAKAARVLINSVGEQQRAEVSLSLAKASHSVYAKYETDANFQLLLSRTPAQIEATQKAALAAVENEPELSRKVTLLKAAADIGNVHSLRIKYLQSKDEVDGATNTFDVANKKLSDAVKGLDAAGRQLNKSGRHQFPVQKWAVN